MENKKEESKSTFFKIKTISQLHDVLEYEKPCHPLITVLDLSKVAFTDEVVHKKVSVPFYNITLKTKTSNAFKYGRDFFDFTEGALLGVGPDQVIEIDYISEKGELEGWSLYFHPDIIRGSGLMEKLTDYGFFGYDTNEALHISDKEKQTLNGIVLKIQEEYSANLDEFSQDVLVSNIELLFNYIKRFYNRQFLTRKSQNTTVLSQFNGLLKSYFESEDIRLNGLPKVHYFAEKLHLSDSYLSDLLKKETGKNTQDHIHFYMIEKAKNLLINTNNSVSEIAFNLGFEYPQYFSRLFKSKTGQTPVAYRKQLN
ncbi:AraC family transcriptional regulator [Flavobacterium ovatum]|uniref:helix-turn-helix domain-containing protein n=1 Tax=Flavobacterium ovatum TaxID=1928857 RepID=UPI0034509766